MAHKKRGGRKEGIMSLDEMENAVKLKFDFGELHKTMADVKASVWRLEKCDD
jgi:hypothetical protein